MCCDAEWKREVVQDHKWDFINVTEFHKTDFLTRLKYVWRYILLFKSMAVYGLDIFTAVTMISSDKWTNAITAKGSEGIVEVKFIIAKWVFVGCIIFSFLLLGYEWFKARQVIRSGDVSYAFTNLLAYDYFSFKNYDNFCLFCHIEGSTKKKDDFAFFIFFTFKEWKRLLLADGPRQSINGLMLYSFGRANGWQTSNIPSYWNQDPITAMLLFSMIATVLIFAGSMVLLIAAAVLYVPLLCYIQGNLKEYVCHKVDKRLSQLVKKNQRLRAQRAAAMEKKLARDGGLRNSKGEFVNVVMQPTLPKIRLDEEDVRETKTGMSRSKSQDTLNSYPASGTPGIYDSYGGYPPSLDYKSPYGQEGGYSSTTRLTDAVGPMGISYPPPTATLPAAAPSFPPRHASPAPPPSAMRPSRSNTQLTNLSSNSGHAPYTPSALTPGGGSFPFPQSSTSIPYPSSNGYDHRSPPASISGGYPQAYPSATRRPSYPSAPDLQPPPTSTSHMGYNSPSAQSGYASFRRSGGSHTGLAYDRPDTDVNVDEGYDSRDPAPSYYSGGSPPRRLTDEKHGYRGNR